MMYLTGFTDRSTAQLASVFRPILYQVSGLACELHRLRL
jgi:hypothetical protein